MLSSLLFRSSTKFAPKSREQRPSLTSFVIRVAYSKGGGGGVLGGLGGVSHGFRGKGGGGGGGGGGDFARIGVGVTWVSGKMEGGSFAANSV